MKCPPAAIIRRFCPVLAAMLIFSVGCTEKSSETGRVSGRVLRHGKGVAMALVQFYPKADQDRATPPLFETPSGEGGEFYADLPPGRYWVWGKATIYEGVREIRLVGEAVPNPVEPKPGRETFLRIELADPSGFTGQAGPDGTGVKGKVKLPAGNGGATVYVYKGTAARPIGPGFVAAREINGDGAFMVNLEPGPYTLAARLRKSGKDYGPPGKNDLVAARIITVSQSSYADAGELVLSAIDEKTWDLITSTMGASATAIEGRVVGPDMKPVEGIRVLAFVDGRMTGKPAFVSGPTGKDGKFILPLAEDGGNYFLGARSRIGGPSSPGEKVGQNRGEKGSGIRVPRGQTLKGISITVEEVW